MSIGSHRRVERRDRSREDNAIVVDPAALEIGDRVTHADYGDGTVDAVTPYLGVRFDRPVVPAARFNDEAEHRMAFTGQCRDEVTRIPEPTPPIGSGDFALGSTIWPGLSKLTEESAEVIQVLGKLMQRGGRTDHWSGDLRKMAIEELGDLRAALSFFVAYNFSAEEAHQIMLRYETKLELFQKWHHENIGKPFA